MTDAISSSKKLSFTDLLNDGVLSKNDHFIGPFSHSAVVAQGCFCQKGFSHPTQPK
jgi:hypothetical protein